MLRTEGGKLEGENNVQIKEKQTQRPSPKAEAGGTDRQGKGKEAQGLSKARDSNLGDHTPFEMKMLSPIT